MAKKYGPDMEVHSYFPEKTNTEFVRVISRDEVELTVFERGCGITLACGTGACATVTAGVLNNLTDSKVKVNLPGGVVFIDWSGSEPKEQRHIFMTGPAKYSFTAEYML
jgi:diaminopimelate epimerase